MYLCITHRVPVAASSGDNVVIQISLASVIKELA